MPLQGSLAWATVHQDRRELYPQWPKTIKQPIDTIDSAELRRQFVFRAVDEVGATLNTALVVMGDKLRLKALAGAAYAHRARQAHRHA